MAVPMMDVVLSVVAVNRSTTVLGGDSPLRQTDRELKPSLVALRDVDSVMQINRQYRR